MALGPALRRLFGPYERQGSSAYRAIFVDLDAWTAQLTGWVPHATAVLEIGCGEGAMTERLAAAYPAARITAIDVTPRLGRLYAGDSGRVTFRQAFAEEIAVETPGGFDLVLLGDVVHHVPPDARASLLRAARTATAPGGRFVFKEWVRSNAPIHWACAASDRYLTGDAVSYLTLQEARSFVGEAFGPAAIRDEAFVRPWRNNVAWLLAP